MTDDNKNSELDAVKLMTQEEFKKLVLLEWITLSKEIRSANKSLKTLRATKSQKEAAILCWMETNGIGKITCDLGEIKVVDTARPSPLSETYLQAQLKRQTKLPSGEIKQVVEEIMKNRPTSHKKQISLAGQGGKRKKQKTSQ